MTEPRQTETSAPPPVSDRISLVGDQLAHTFRTLLDNLPGDPVVAREMAQALNVDKFLMHKLLSALRSGDPLATAYSIPGPEPLTRVVRAAKAKGAPMDAVHAAEAAITAFKNLIRQDGGDRSGLDAIISTLLPDTRGRFETLAKQSVFRGMRQLKGISANVTFMTVVVSPSTDAIRCDSTVLRGYFGLRCVRPGAAMRIGMISRVSNASAAMLTLDGAPVTDPRQVVLTDFCSVPPAEFLVQQKKDAVVLTLSWSDVVGPRSACDFVMGELRRKGIRSHRAPDDPLTRAAIHDGITIPTKTYLFDLLLHQEVYPDWEPRVRFVEMGELGLVSVNDDSRQPEVFDLDVHVKPMGFGIERFRAREIPRYVEILGRVCQDVGVPADRLRGYRLRVDYPVFGTAVQFVFDLPLAPPTQ